MQKMFEGAQYIGGVAICIIGLAALAFAVFYVMSKTLNKLIDLLRFNGAVTAWFFARRRFATDVMRQELLAKNLRLASALGELAGWDDVPEHHRKWAAVVAQDPFSAMPQEMTQSEFRKRDVRMTQCEARALVALRQVGLSWPDEALLQAVAKAIQKAVVDATADRPFTNK